MFKVEIYEVRLGCFIDTQPPSLKLRFIGDIQNSFVLFGRYCQGIGGGIWLVLGVFRLSNGLNIGIVINDVIRTQHLIGI